MKGKYYVIGALHGYNFHKKKAHLVGRGTTMCSNCLRKELFEELAMTKKLGHAGIVVFQEGSSRSPRIYQNLELEKSRTISAVTKWNGRKTWLSKSSCHMMQMRPCES
jgi:hypothetical protein